MNFLLYNNQEKPSSFNKSTGGKVSMATTTTIPTLGSPEFWALYDKFTGDEEEIERLMDDPESPLALQMYDAIKAPHETGTIYRLNNFDRGWVSINAWLALKPGFIRGADGTPCIRVRAGDVMAVQHQWDRDCVITHCPSPIFMSGWFLHAEWEPVNGIVLPLFDKETILRCIRLRIEKNADEALHSAEEEAEEWGWP